MVGACPPIPPAFSMEDVFNKAFHANSFAAIGVTPIWRPFQRAQVRLSGHMFMPFRSIEQEGGDYRGSLRAMVFQP